MNRRPEKAAAVLELRLFGPFEIRVHGTPQTSFSSRKAQWLLALLALRIGREVSRNYLAETLWPDSEPEKALFNLRQTLSALRRALGPAASCMHALGQHALLLDPTEVWVDVADFDARVTDGERKALEQAVALYRAPLLADCVEEWALAERVPREQAYLGALEALAAQAASAGDLSAAVGCLRLLVSVDPYRESAHRALMQALAEGGDRAAMTQVYRDLRLLLHRDLNADPAPETEADYRRLRARPRQPALPSSTARESTGPLRQLPVPLSDLIGREQEVEEAAGWLGKSRLVTLTGSGGVGKTRLAIAVAERISPRFPDGVWFVDLAALSDPTLVPQAVAKALGLREESGHAIDEALDEAVASRTLLLVLDNCEHLLDACAQLVDRLLSACRDLRVLATSRQALGLPGERVYRVPSLSLPPLGQAVEEKEPSALLEYGAVRLFIERAAQVNPAFRLNRRNARAVIAICRRLDGIPLALEMASARVRSLSAQEIHDRLEDRFKLLTGGSRAALPRQRTLQATLDWSWSLLTEEEQALLRRLSIFAGGWTLEAADIVCRGEGREKREESGVFSSLDVLSSLVDKSLVVVEEWPGSGTRYRLLETVGEYAKARLREAGEEVSLRRRHQDYFVQWAEAMEVRAQGPESLDILARLACEHDNFRAVLTWCLRGRDDLALEPQSDDAGKTVAQESTVATDASLTPHTSRLTPPDEVGLRLAGALGDYWEAHGHFQEGRRYLQEALAQTTHIEPAAARARALQSLASLTVDLDQAEAERLFEESLTIWRRLEDKHGLIRALTATLYLHKMRMDFRAAEHAYRQMLEIYQELGDRRGVAAALSGLGRTAHDRGDYASARAFHEESLTVCRAIEDNLGVARCLGLLAELEEACREYERGRMYYAEALEIFYAQGDKRSYVLALKSLGHLIYAEGNLAEARAVYERVVDLDREWSFAWDICFAMIWVARVARSQGDYAAARAVAQETLALARSMGRRHNVAQAQNELARTAMEQDDMDAARFHSIASLQSWIEAQHLWGIAEALESRAHLSVLQRHAKRGVLLFGATAALRETGRFPLRPWEQSEQEARLSAARDELSEAVFARAWAEGRALTLEQAIAYALDENGEPLWSAGA